MELKQIEGRLTVCKLKTTGDFNAALTALGEHGYKIV